eukprot:CAMPEP_0116899538 /NCGR_PEP_ID=MMETSP0467-20121206/8080_1 /TAXON_ID=283647 /ORGANISM="Mesodinium pulex, Strain SPMC105" /LENGTH=155 /DNA_ID=CAMNT_0004572405 /DNA_START=96 /DNA_END=563 /DNA_ORIENTATION=+
MRSLLYKPKYDKTILFDIFYHFNRPLNSAVIANHTCPGLFTTYPLFNSSLNPVNRPKPMPQTLQTAQHSKHPESLTGTNLANLNAINNNTLQLNTLDEHALAILLEDCVTELKYTEKERVVVVESPFSSIETRKKIAKTIFEDLGFKELLFLNSS